MKNIGRYLSKKLLLTLTSATLLLTTGCLKEEAAPEATPGSSTDASDSRAVLVESLDKQAVQLVSGINEVIITGDFIKNIAVANPPKPIPLGDNNEVQKAISYLLSNQENNSGYINYRPDSRLCSELIAKENPNSCMKVMEQLVLTQIPIDKTSGVVELRVAGEKFFTLYYGANVVSAYASLTEIVSALTKVSDILVQNGELGFASSLPAVHEGGIQFDISNQMSISMVKASITSALDIQGLNKNGQAYSIQAAVSDGLINVALESASGMGYLSINLPQVKAIFSAFDQQNMNHQVEVQFPGATGTINLDNSAASITALALKLSASDIYASVDGQTAVHATAADEFNVQLTAQNGDLTANFMSPLTAQAEFSTNALIQSTGTISASIDGGTQVYFPYQAQQAKVLFGSVQLTGTQDFTGSLDAQANSCIEGQQGTPVFLQVAPCQF